MAMKVLKVRTGCDVSDLKYPDENAKLLLHKRLLYY